jgi:hypothetical protein
MAKKETEMNTLARIQKELKAPKGQFNSFAKFHYRSCEDILEAVKPLLGTATLVLNDEIVMLGDRFYVKATAILTDGGEHWAVSAYARESAEKKGMDSAQLTGATSSYARKYALSGLFCIDDNKDADSNGNGHKAVITDAQKSQIVDMLAGKNIPIATLLTHLKLKDLSELPSEKFEYVVTIINTKKGTANGN